MNNQTVNVRLFSYKSFRHYGGREIKPTAHICPATFVKNQTNGTVVVDLISSCAGYKPGHRIAVLEKDFNI